MFKSGLWKDVEKESLREDMGRLPGIFHAGGWAWASPMFEGLCHRKVSLSLVGEKMWAVRGVYPVARAGSYDFVVSPIKSFQIGSIYMSLQMHSLPEHVDLQFLLHFANQKGNSISKSQGLDVHQPPSPKTWQVHPDRFESAKRGRRGWSLTFTWESTKPKVWGNILTWDVRCRMVCRLKGMKLYLSEASVSVPLKVRLFCESNKWIKISVTSSSIIAKSNFLHCQFLQNYPHKIHHPGIERLKCRLSCLHDGVLLEVANVPEWSMEDWWIPKVFGSNRSSINLQKQFWQSYISLCNIQFLIVPFFHPCLGRNFWKHPWKNQGKKKMFFWNIEHSNQTDCCFGEQKIPEKKKKKTKNMHFISSTSRLPKTLMAGTLVVDLRGIGG